MDEQADVLGQGVEHGADLVAHGAPADRPARPCRGAAMTTRSAARAVARSRIVAGASFVTARVGPERHARVLGPATEPLDHDPPRRRGLQVVRPHAAGGRAGPARPGASGTRGGRSRRGRAGRRASAAGAGIAARRRRRRRARAAASGGATGGPDDGPAGGGGTTRAARGGHDRRPSRGAPRPATARRRSPGSPGSTARAPSAGASAGSTPPAATTTATVRKRNMIPPSPPASGDAERGRRTSVEVASPWGRGPVLGLRARGDGTSPRRDFPLERLRG